MAESPTLLLTGATGFVGHALFERLRGEYPLRVLLRDPRGSLPQDLQPLPGMSVADVQLLPGDLSTTLPALPPVDVVVHCAARVHVMQEHDSDPLAAFRRVNVEGTLALARRAVEAGARRFVFLSSIKVNGEATAPGRPFTADDPPAPGDPYGLSKYEAEKALLQLGRETGLEIVIVRPVLVYGPGVKANFRRLLGWLKRGIPLPLGALDNRRSLLALDNLVDLLALCIHHPAAANHVFLASDGEDLSTPELLRRLGAALGRPARLWSLPPAWLSVAGRLLGRSAEVERLCGSLQVDSRATRERLNWQPPVAVDAALAATARDFLENVR